MANEITALERDRSGNLSALLYYPIPANIKVVGVVPTPSEGLPSAATLTAQEIQDLDAGDALFWLVKVGMPAGQTPAATLARLRTRYSQLQQKLLDDYTARYEFWGQRFDKA